MTDILSIIETEVYNKCALRITDFSLEAESKEYAACRFKLNDRSILCRNGKKTPKKIGQFVTFWKRSLGGPIEPFHETDSFDYYIVNVQNERNLGQFVFPKSILLKKGIISTDKKEGKRAFRVYPSWDTTESMQAKRTQKWQLEYFFIINNTLDFNAVSKLYHTDLNEV